MITYVNTVLVNNLAAGTVLTQAPAASAALNTPSADAGKFVVMTMDDVENPYLTTETAKDVNTLRIGIVTSNNIVKINHKTGAASYLPIVKWSAPIKQSDIKSYVYTAYNAQDYTNPEDKIEIDFTSLDQDVLDLFKKGGKRIVVRLTFKDTPTRYRKWTESYEYVTKTSDTTATIATGIANLINKEWKRARVSATAAGAKVTLVALPYDDDNSNDTINWANKVRFNANVYFTDPAAEGWDSKNKFFPTGVVITKTPGKEYTATGKLVRDREAQAMGYEGILNRGEGTWPIIKPQMTTNINENYDALTIEFENTYHTADDLIRKTKQSVEVYGVSGSLANVKAIVDAFYGIESQSSTTNPQS